MSKDVYFHSGTVQKFREKLFNNVFTKYDINSDEKRITETISDTEKHTYDGFEVKDSKTRKTYFVPSNWIEQMPIKIKNARKLVYSKKIYYLSEDVVSVKFPARDEMSFKQWFDVWFPLNHTNPSSVRIAKFCILASALDRGYSRLVSEKSFGKDGIVDNLIQLVGKGRNISNATAAKLFQLISEDFTAFNELAGFGGEKKAIFQQFFLEAGDANKTIYEHGSTGSDKTGNKADISKYGFVIMHNLPEYYFEKGMETFEQMFTHAVFDRFFPVLLEGQVESKHQFIGKNFDFESISEEATPFLKQWISKFYFMKETFTNMSNKYDISKYNLELDGRNEAASRWYNTFYRIAVLVSEYSDSESEFYEIMDSIYDANRKYVNKVMEMGLI